MKKNIHKTAEVSKKAKIGDKTIIWNDCQIREGVSIGNNCSLGKNVYIGPNVIISDNVRIQNNVSIFEGVTIKEGVFIGPHVVFTNDKNPRSIYEDGTPKKKQDWKLEETTVEFGASIGANSTILPGLTIGKYAMVGAGSVVVKDVPDFTVAYGNPAKVRGLVNKEGKVIKRL
jgi:acetyltransferase-like isoleucine patch superfamily enzyme